MVELVDTLDLKSNDHCGRAGSSPAPSTRYFLNTPQALSIYWGFFIQKF